MIRSLSSVITACYFSFLFLGGSEVRLAPSFSSPANAIFVDKKTQDILEDSIEFFPAEYHTSFSSENLARCRESNQILSSGAPSEISTPSDITESSSVPSPPGLPRFHSESINAVFGQAHPSTEAGQSESGDTSHDAFWAPYRTSPAWQEVEPKYNARPQSSKNRPLKEPSRAPSSDLPTTSTPIRTEPHGGPSSAENDSVPSIDKLNLRKIQKNLPSFGSYNINAKYDPKDEPRMARSGEAMPSVFASPNPAPEFSRGKRKREDPPIQQPAGGKFKSNLSPLDHSHRRQLQNEFALHLVKFDKKNLEFNSLLEISKDGLLVPETMSAIQQQIHWIVMQSGNFASLEKIARIPDLSIGYFRSMNKEGGSHLTWVLDSRGNIRTAETVMSLMRSLIVSTTLCHFALFQHLNMLSKHHLTNHSQFVFWLLELIFCSNMPILGFVPENHLNKRHEQSQTILIDYFLNDKKNPFDPFTTSVSLLGIWYQNHRKNVWENKFNSVPEFVKVFATFMTRQLKNPGK